MLVRKRVGGILSFDFRVWSLVRLERAYRIVINVVRAAKYIRNYSVAVFKRQKKRFKFNLIEKTQEQNLLSL
ncbi:MAG: hypothetical protein LBB88_08470 [Planctomycetaceae bacterium]|nr:hypothetical protein [Planctomycetaceae bacterium]